MKKNLAQRVVYNNKYYLAQRLLKNKKFLKEIDDLKAEFAKWDCPIPSGGVRSAEELLEWQKKLWSMYSKIRRSKKYNDALHAITRGAEKISREQFEQIERLEETALPPVVYGYRIDKILEEFDLDPENEEDKHWLEGLIFYNQSEYPTYTTELKFITARKNKAPELWVRFFAHTKFSDIPLEELQYFQKKLPEYRARNKAKSLRILERNREVKRVYYAETKRAHQWSERAPAGHSVADTVVQKLKGKYPELNRTLVEQIVNKG